MTKRSQKHRSRAVRSDKLSERFQREVLADCVRLEKSYDRYRQTRKNLPRLVSRSIGRLVKTRSAKLKTFVEKDDMVYINSHCDKNAVLVVNATGKELHSTLALLSYLRLSTRPRYNIYALTQVDTGLHSKLLEFASMTKAELCVVFEQAVPYLSGFNLMVPRATRTDRSNDVLDFLSTKGHEVGIYSYEEDRPTFQTLRPESGFLNALASVVGEVYGFAVSDDIWAGVNATAFVLGDFDFGITAQLSWHNSQRRAPR